MLVPGLMHLLYAALPAATLQEMAAKLLARAPEPQTIPPNAPPIPALTCEWPQRGALAGMQLQLVPLHLRSATQRTGRYAVCVPQCRFHSLTTHHACAAHCSTPADAELADKLAAVKSLQLFPLVPPYPVPSLVPHPASKPASPAPIAEEVPAAAAAAPAGAAAAAGAPRAASPGAPSELPTAEQAAATGQNLVGHFFGGSSAAAPAAAAPETPAAEAAAPAAAPVSEPAAAAAPAEAGTAPAPAGEAERFPAVHSVGWQQGVRSSRCQQYLLVAKACVALPPAQHSQALVHADHTPALPAQPAARGRLCRPTR